MVRPGSSSHDESFDVVVVGGGVLGTAIAARLAATTARVCLVEAAPDVADGASKGNAGIAVSYYGDPGSLETQLIVESTPGWERLAERLDVPYRRSGGLVVALTPDEEERLPTLRDDALACGARAELLDGRLAPGRSSLWSPTAAARRCTCRTRGWSTPCA